MELDASADSAQLAETSPKLLTVVAIGASAGGIEACRTLIKNLPSGDICYIFCQHLSPHHTSLLREILERDTEMTVIETADKLELKANHFYVAVPNSDIRVERGRILLSTPESSIHPKPSVDKLLISMSKSVGIGAIAVVLSGTGSDGGKGVLAIKKSGGLVLVQDPSSCQYEGMPRAAIASGVADLVGTPIELAAGLNRLVQQVFASDEPADDVTDTYSRVLTRIASVTGVDFNRYRETSTRRRILRRMAMLNIPSIEKYEEVLASDQREVWQLTNNTFVVVSEFNRDEMVFSRLKTQIITDLRDRDQSEEYRVWVVGCATGEEAYTLAMLVYDIMAEIERPINLRILATDLSAHAVALARSGVYERDKMQKVPTTWYSKYFTVDGDGWRVKDFIRSNVTFSLHNVISDPPFSRLDLISCRNLLIYFNEETQNDVLTTFAFALKDSSVLVLGSSETCNLKNNYAAVDEPAKIYRRIGIRPAKLGIPALNKLRESTAVKETSKAQDNGELKFFKSVVEHFAPPLLVIDENNNIVFKEGDYQLLTNERAGFVNVALFDNINDAFRAECRALLFRCRQSGDPARGAEITISAESSSRTFVINVTPVGTKFPSWHIVYLVERPPSKTLSKAETEVALIEDLDRELSETRQNLQVVIEELETANEQLQVYNEELQSSNEEYQSTNEELQTVNEELQSSNEELITITEEHTNQTRSYQRLNSDLENIQESIRLPIVVLNKDNRMKRYNQAFAAMFRDQPIKVGDLVYAFETGIPIDDLKALLEQVVHSDRTLSHEFGHNERFYECQISPYKNGDGETDGCTLVFYETTAFKSAETTLRFEKVLAQTTLDTVNEGVIRLGPDLTIQYANAAACDITGWSIAQMLGKTVARVVYLLDEDDEYPLEKLLQESLDKKTRANAHDRPLLLKARRGNDVYIEYSIAPFAQDDTSDEVGGVFVFRDVTERRNQFSSLLWNSTHDALTGLVNRDEIERRLDAAILTAKRNQIVSSLLYLDLDQFKVVNDTCGHAAGDKLLQQISSLMAGMLRSRDTLARLGGDEFAVLLEKCPAVEAEAIAKKVQAAIRGHRFMWDEKLFHVGVSIGIVEISSHYDQVSELLIHADTSCYHAKEAGRDRVQIHSLGDSDLEEKRFQLNMVADINEAIEQDKFRLYFQELKPALDVESTRWEVLVRMFNRPGDFILPGAFLPSAERFGLIKRIDLWVLENALETVSHLSEASGCDFPCININVSGATLAGTEYFDQLGELLSRYRVEPAKLCFELTETVAISNMYNAKRFIQKVRDIGCSFALDDFGTGMSSFSYLRYLPMDYIKVDAAFVSGIDDPVNACIVESVKKVADLLDLKTIAEGVEEREQLSHVSKIGIDYFQGFYLGRPMPFEEFSAKVVAENKKGQPKGGPHVD